MSDEWVSLGDVPLVADERWLHAVNGAAPAELEAPVRIVGVAEFMATEEETAEALLGTSTETLLPAGGMLLMYGDGGAGKTTLTMDAVAHLGSGLGWLGLEVERPARCLIIENEGPRGKFRQQLSEKHEAWSGPAYTSSLSVLEEPWTQFSLRNPTHRAALAAHCEEASIDVVVMGPLVTLGMVGGGTPDEVGAFESLIREWRELLSSPVALWVVHHENKAGDVSGAWERVPDTLCHVQAQGNGHTRLVWRKARWSSERHGTTMDLVWEEGRTFSIRADEEIDYHAELLEALGDNWITVREAARLIERRQEAVKEALSDLVERGELEYEVGPKGRSHRAQCYRRSTAPDAREQYGAVELGPLHENYSRVSLSPRRGEGTGSSTSGRSSKPLREPGAVPLGGEDGIPF